MKYKIGPMRDMEPPFQFDLRTQLSDALRKLRTRVGSISISLPFVSFAVDPADAEKKIAREIVIRMSDKRVLNAFECCDSCVEHALASLQEIRKVLVDKRVELSKDPDSPLHVLIELMLEGIRQFLTFTERLQKESSFPDGFMPPGERNNAFHMHRDEYLAALEMLRAHLHRCLLQTAKIAGTEIPEISGHMRYDEAWSLEAYRNPELPEGA